MTITIPSFEKDRGTFFQDGETGSTRQNVVKDSRNQGYTSSTGVCGCDTFKSIGASFSIYDNVNCTRRLVGATSISAQIRSDEYNAANFNLLVDELQTFIADKIS